VLSSERDPRRSYERIEEADFERLGTLAKNDREEFFARNLHWRHYAARIVCVAVCQGAAKHFVDNQTGVKDFDVWTFFAEHSTGPLKVDRRIMHADFGPSKFGVDPEDRGPFTGRRVDFLMRSIRCPLGADAVGAIRNYLSRGATDSARRLSEKAVVFIEPAHLCGSIVWPVAG
jgi:hypothetical protein